MRVTYLLSIFLCVAFVISICACTEEAGPIVPVLPEPPALDAIPAFVNEWEVFGNSMTVDSQGLVYVLQYFKTEFQVYSTLGETLGVWDPVLDIEMSDPIYLKHENGKFVFLYAGHIRSWIRVCDNRRELVNQWPEYHVQKSFAGGIDPIAIDSRSQIYMLSYNREEVVKYDAAGVFVTEWSTRGANPAEDTSPSGIVLGPNDVVYVADTINDRIMMYTSGGEYLGAFGERGRDTHQFNWPRGLAVDEAGALYIADSSNYRIKKTDLEGNYLGQIDIGRDHSSPGMVQVKGRHVFVMQGTGDPTTPSRISHYMYQEK